ncbi:hypothetical protein A2765_06080 [Candidatus Kaiserbacteria bacterium RIFCSPHIGHO2_01_FULL_56_24]|uniref:Peptidase M15B domain-containing protein n=1 Tax=Candidatus Kaiserbacteria bacterium RIFCSPHIGHO2_01_FULL_56_24 TaxID=1798487 RepID=A0A1F6D8B9_9BACT|nr:MAG: hypothetical protein A2765_06080 [Candidatus Kaiserbacteria bacterium RIFCSPHIGHO2_01_FULL_56_24]
MLSNKRVGGIALLFVILFSGTPVSALDRPIDQKLFCGENFSGYGSAIAFIKTRSQNQASIDKLTPQFACDLAALLKAAPPGLGVKVGWYPVTASVATMGVSYCQHFECIEGSNSHPRGLAADLLFGGTKGNGGAGASGWCRQNALCTWAHQNAGSFGLMFRLMPESGCQAGYFEPWHIELKGVSGCQGSDTFGSGTTQIAAPFGIGDAFRAALGQQSAQPSPAPQPALPVRPVTQTQSPISAFDGNVPADSGGGDVTGASSQLNENGSGAMPGGNAADQLEQLAFGTPTSTNSTHATSVPLVVSGANATGIIGSQTVQQQSISTGNVSPSQQTFVSGDLSWQPEATFQPPLSGIPAILETMKQILLRMLPYLTPFGTYQHLEE